VQQFDFDWEYYLLSACAALAAADAIFIVCDVAAAKTFDTEVQMSEKIEYAEPGRIFLAAFSVQHSIKRRSSRQMPAGIADRSFMRGVKDTHTLTGDCSTPGQPC
jgi:hypothetical protein